MTNHEPNYPSNVIPIAASHHWWTTEGVVSEEFAVKDERPIWEETEGGIPNIGTVQEMEELRPRYCYGCDLTIGRSILGNENYCAECGEMIEEWAAHQGY